MRWLFGNPSLQDSISVLLHFKTTLFHSQFPAPLSRTAAFITDSGQCMSLYFDRCWTVWDTVLYCWCRKIWAIQWLYQVDPVQFVKLSLTIVLQKWIIVDLSLFLANLLADCQDLLTYYKKCTSYIIYRESLKPIGQVLAKRQDLEVGHTWMGHPV